MSNPFKVGARVASTTMPGTHGTVTARHGDERVAVRWDGTSGFIQHEERVTDLKPSRRAAPQGQADRDDVLGFSFVLLDAARVRDLWWPSSRSPSSPGSRARATGSPDPDDDTTQNDDNGEWPPVQVGTRESAR